MGNRIENPEPADFKRQTEAVDYYKCFGNMFRENGNLTYGAMVCEECEVVEECRMHSVRKV